MERLTGEVVMVNVGISPQAAQIIKKARLGFSMTAGFLISSALSEWALRYGLDERLRQMSPEPGVSNKPSDVEPAAPEPQAKATEVESVVKRVESILQDLAIVSS